MTIIKKLGITDKEMEDNEMEDIIKTFNNWKRSSEFDGMWYGYKYFQSISRIDIKKLKKIILELRKLKIVEYVSLFNYEGMLAGSGYILNDQYEGMTWKEIKEITKR